MRAGSSAGKTAPVRHAEHVIAVPAPILSFTCEEDQQALDPDFLLDLQTIRPAFRAHGLGPIYWLRYTNYNSRKLTSLSRVYDSARMIDVWLRNT